MGIGVKLEEIDSRPFGSAQGKQLKVERQKKEFYTEVTETQRARRRKEKKGTMPSKLRPRNRAPTRSAEITVFFQDYA